MTREQQCKLARMMTGCNASNNEIIDSVKSMNELYKEEASQVVDSLLLQHDLPFDKGYPLIKSDFSKVAQKYGVNAAALFWVYMEWKGQKNER